MDINPLDYATEFTFPATDGGEIRVSAMIAPGKWMITRRREALTTAGTWIDLAELDPIADVRKVAYDLDLAVAAAHRLSTT